MTSTMIPTVAPVVAVEDDPQHTASPTTDRPPFPTAAPSASPPAIGAGPDAAAREAEPASPVGPSLLAAACAAGAVRLSRLRGTGTLRRLPYLTGAAREHAEWFAYRLDQGASVAQVAEETETSRATVRRALAALNLTEEIESGLHDDLYDADLVELVFGGSDEEDE